MQRNFRVSWSWQLLCWFSLMLIAGCATNPLSIEPPKVQLVNISQAKQQGLSVEFMLDLKVINPNSRALNLVGMNFDVELEGINIISGAANDVPSVPAYGNQMVGVSVSVGLIEGVKLINQLANNNDRKLAYQLTTRLNTGIPIIGVIPVVDSGHINLDDFVGR